MTESPLLNQCLSFIDDYWKRIIHPPEDSRDNNASLMLPHTYITPNDKKFNVMFYWDSFFLFRGLMDTKREWIITDMVDNFVYLFNTHRIIPNLSSPAMLDRSQPPFFSSMVFDGYYTLKRNLADRPASQMYLRSWLKKRMDVAKAEYETVWENFSEYHHKIDQYELNRYGDRDVGYAHTSEVESGWDFTSRFYNRCNDFLPIDLNSYLHKYEKDFAKAAHILGNKEEEEKWEAKAHKRHEQMDKYMWNEEKGFFFDYDYTYHIQSDFYSLAGFVPLWAKMATVEQAKRAVEKLPLFETEHGLTITAAESVVAPLSFEHVPKALRISIEQLVGPKQWDYPHIWSPLEYLTVIGLLRYGYQNEAIRIMENSVKTHLRVFEKYGFLLEKLDATTGEKPKDFHYPSQEGFGWTNAVFYRYVEILKYIEAKQGDIYDKDDLEKGAPYSITAIIH